MHLPNKQSDTITDLAVKLRGLTEILLAPLSPSGEPVKEQRSADLFAGHPSRVLLYVAEGEVEYRVQGKVITYFEQGDLIGLPRSLSLPDGQFTCTVPVVLVPYDRDALVDQVNGDPQLQKHWAYYLLCQLSFYQQALAQEIREEFQPTAGFLYYRAGETIIQQGTLADKVYTLLEGSADAVCDDVKVGEVHAGEIFGALAVFTRQRRIASVIATNDCTVLAVRKEEFIDLIDHQPQICVGLIEEMAAKINQLNSQLLALTERRF